MQMHKLKTYNMRKTQIENANLCNKFIEIY